MALSPKEVWGHGHGSTTFECRQKWDSTATWIRYMVGEVKIKRTSSLDGTPLLVRYEPEGLRYNESGVGADQRVQWCTGLSQIDQGGNELTHTRNLNAITGVAAGTVTEDVPFSQPFTNWPETDWCRYHTVFETTPYWVRSTDQVIDMTIAAGANAGARELYRYIDRSRRNYNKEQPIPAASPAGGFLIIRDNPALAAERRAIGQVGFRHICMADVTYKWIRVPVGWPPPPGWQFEDEEERWPPLINPVAQRIVAGLVVGGGPRTRDSYIGNINSVAFDCADPEGYCWQAGELLYTGYDDSYKYFDACGDRVCDITFHFKYKEGGWNTFLSALGVWEEVSLTGLSTGTRPYQSVDFNNLFQWIDV